MTVRELDAVFIDTITGPMRTIVFEPITPGEYPGIILFSEIFQITGPIRRIAKTIAGNGFVVAVPEIYHEIEPAGMVLAYDALGSERGNANKTVKELSSYDDDARALVKFLMQSESTNHKVGAMGVCLGGHLAFRAALDPAVASAACIYPTDIHNRGLGKGLNDDTLDRMSQIKSELLMVWGRQDPHIPREGRSVIYNAMTDADINFSWHEFNAAHAFMRDEGVRYDPVASQFVINMAVELFKRTLVR